MEQEKVNMHGEHAASCLCCKYLDMGYESDWSEVTPGRGWYCYCSQGVFDWLDPETDDFHKFHVLGVTCPKFKPRSA